YKYDIDGKKLIWFEIHYSFHVSLYFTVCEDNELYKVYWRYALSNPEQRKLFEELHNVKVSSLGELIETEEYKETLQKYSPVCSALLNENQKNIIDIFLKKGINKDADKPHGRDGHSYFIEVYCPKYQKYRCWCVLPEEWSVLADVINMLVGVSQADFQR
ncbi:MAG: hypothetical protein K2K02_02495, partial [Ruminococcus sp.]|nr:hypothetical protein [Ruminococcus sp.]